MVSGTNSDCPVGDDVINSLPTVGSVGRLDTLYGLSNAAPPPAPVPVPTVVNVGDAWIQGGLRLIRRGTGGAVLRDGASSHLETHGGESKRIDLELRGRQLRTSVIVDSLADGAGKDFVVTWDIQSFDRWQADLRNSAVTGYNVLASEFAPRIHNATWHMDVNH
jgi:hypothetical protein